jgi:hypothetical protein
VLFIQKENVMNKLLTVTVIPLFAGFLLAQSSQSTRTESESSTTKVTTYTGTLVDAGCRSKHSEHTETITTRTPDGSSTSTRTETETVECPVTTTTTTFGLQTPDGKYVRFDEPSNTRIVEIVKTNKDWNGAITSRKLVKVHVVGEPNGDVLVMKSIE